MRLLLKDEGFIPDLANMDFFLLEIIAQMITA